MGTIHSESPRGALDQLVTFAQMAEEHLGREALVHMVGRRVELVNSAEAARGPPPRRKHI